MHPKLKRVLLVLGFLSLVAGISFGLWYVFFRGEPLTPPATPGTTDQNQLPQADDGTPLTGTIPTTPGTLPGSTTILPLNGSGTSPATASRSTLLVQGVGRPISVSPNNGSSIRYYDDVDGRFYRIDGNGNKTALSNKQFYNVDDIRWGNASDKAILVFPDQSKIFYDFTQDRQVTLPSYWEDIKFSPTDEQIATKSVGRSATNRFW